MTTVFWKRHGFLPGLALALILGVISAGELAAKGGKGNAEGRVPVVFSPRGGVFATNVSLQLAATAAPVHYTIDGSEPDEHSPLYETPLRLERSTLVRAVSCPPGQPPSAIVAEMYTVLEEDLRDFTSNLPLVLIHSFGTNITHESKNVAGIQLLDATNGGRARLSAGPAFSGPSVINIRGRASLRYPKNSFTVKLTDGAGDPEAVSLLGLPAESDWVLYAPFPDKTLMRDVLAYEISSRMGHWAPRTRFVEVFVNQTGGKLGHRDYAGVYVLVEKIKRDKSRVNVAKLKPDDISEPRITGGYIFKKDHVGFGGGGPGGGDLGGYMGAGSPSMSSRNGYPTAPGGFPGDPNGFQPTSRSNSRGITSSSSSSSSSSSRSSSSRLLTNYLGRAMPVSFNRGREVYYSEDDEESSFLEEESFRTVRTNKFYFVEPEPDEITSVQKAWLQGYLNELEQALYGPDFRDPAKGYAAFLDPDSFIDYHLTVEATKNVDGFRFSVFFHKDRGGRLKADPIWDWNLSFGNANGKQGWLPEFWLWPQLDNKEYTWYRRLFEDPDFGQRYVDRWTQLRTNVLANASLLGRVDELAALLNEAQKRNFEKWPILGRPVNPNFFVGSSYEEEVTWMKKFIETRLNWIERQFPPVPSLSFEAPGGPAALKAGPGEIHFTLDGSDPRARGGEVSPAARRYEQPVALPKGARLFARVRQDNRWSGPLVFPAAP